MAQGLGIRLFALAASIGLSPLLILTPCGPERVLVVSMEPPDDLSCLTTPGVGRPGDGAVARAVDQGHPHAPSESVRGFADSSTDLCVGGGGGGGSSGGVVAATAGGGGGGTPPRVLHREANAGSDTDPSGAAARNTAATAAGVGRQEQRRGYSRACTVAHGYFLRLRTVAHGWM